MYDMDRLAFRIAIVISIFFRLSECDLNRYTFKVTEDGKGKFIQEMKQYEFTKLCQITPSTFVFEYTGKREASTVFSEVKDIFRDTIVACEPVKLYNDTIKPGDKRMHEAEYEIENLVCSNYYGFNVSEVWAMGITGKGVVVGINDVGINTYLDDLQGNIKKELSMNFLTNKNNVTPELFPSYEDIAPYFTDHGNRVASVIAATNANNVSAGIAFSSSIVALKIFNVTLERYDLLEPEPRYWTSSDIIAKAFSHALNQIDIFVNAWTTTKIFDSLDLSTREALQYGVKTGRYGRGNIYLVPAGPAGNEFSNNINTITVGTMGQHGTIPDSVRLDASVITVGLHNGNSVTSEYMVTTSHHNKCVTSFKGMSAAIALVAGIIALALEANSNLTKRDVEHLLVHASDHTGFKETPFFNQNGAGIYFHPLFGFGLLNAHKLVKLAQEHKGIPSQLSKEVLRTNSSTHHKHIQTFVFCYSCDISSDVDCLTMVEHAEVTITFTTVTKYLTMKLFSPYHTESVLIHRHLSVGELRELSSSKMVKFVSVHFWDETPFGKWKLKLQSHRDTSETHVSSILLTLYGTKNTDRTINNIGDCPKGNTEQPMAVDRPSSPETHVNKCTGLLPITYVAILFTAIAVIIVSM